MRGDGRDKYSDQADAETRDTVPNKHATTLVAKGKHGV
jgi:hypothetical protein